mgnify:CR=1 FL=1
MNFAADIFDERRYGLITGSACSVLFPNKDARVGQISYAKELAQQKFFKFYDERSTWQMQHGHLSESFALVNFQNYINPNAENGDFKMIDEYGGTCDCLCPEYGVDFKCPTTMGTWLDYLYTGIDKQQYYQCQMYMWLFDKPKWIVAAYLIETNYMSDNGLIYPIDEDKRTITIEVEPMPDFESELRKRGQFVIDKREEFIEQLKKQFNQ